MKIKLDENLPLQLGLALKARGHDVDTVKDEGLQGEPDKKIWEVTQREGRFLITQDLDFSDVRSFPPGTHAGILLVRMTDPGRIALRERIDAVFDTEQVEQWQGWLVVVTENQIRVRRPSDPAKG